jgi:hypothetical protein
MSEEKKVRKVASAGGSRLKWRAPARARFFLKQDSVGRGPGGGGSGNLRGLAAKVGQMASYVDGVVPEAHHREAHETARAALAPIPSRRVRRDPRGGRGGSFGALIAGFR